MFLGHFAVAFGARAVVPRTSLGSLFLASQFVDLLWPTLLLLDLEEAEISPGITAVTPLDFVDYPISHSLLMAGVWGVLLGAIAWVVGKDLRAATVLGCCVVSHWLLDFIVHRPDLPVAFSGTTFAGLGLWNSVPGTLIVEGGLLAAGVAIYASATRARNRIGAIGLWVLTGFLVIVYLLNVFGPPPPNMTAVAWAGQAMWLIVAAGYWVDRHRRFARKPGPARKRIDVSGPRNRGERDRAR